MSRRRRRYTPVQQPRAGVAELRQVVQEELSKALRLPAGATATPVTAAYLAALQQRGQFQPQQSAALTRGGNNPPFGPGVPLIPAPLDPPLASGRPAPRRYQYDTSVNLQINDRHVPWSMLRDAADVPLVRRCIEARKSAIIGLDWAFTIDPTRIKRIAAATGASRHQIGTDLATQYAEDIGRLQDWWTKPDRINNLSFSQWLTTILEDQLVLDAVAIYPHMNLGGELMALEPIDGTTIKPLLDDRGATPQFPLAAYQQILYGFPRGEFSPTPPQKTAGQFVSAVYGPVHGLYAPTDTLIYEVRNRRSNSPYGFSNVEAALPNIDLWLRRFDWLRSEYAAGVVPEMLVSVDTAMTPDLLAQYEQVFNDELAGRNDQRHRARFLPNGFTAEFPPGMDAKFSPLLDLHLIRLVCADFDILPSSLGFVPTEGLGGKGHQEGESESENKRGTLPTAAWLTDTINEISRNWLGMPDEVTFQFTGLDEDDEERQASALVALTGAAIKVANEGRDELGLPRFTFPEADQPYVLTATGPVFLDPKVQAAAQPAPPPAPPGAPQGNQPQPGEEPAGKPATPVKPPPRNSTSSSQGKNGAKEGQRNETKAFLAFAEKRIAAGKWRDFRFETHDGDVAIAANKLASAGDLDAVRALFEMVN